MPSKLTLLKIKPDIERKINKIMNESGLRFATVCKMLIYERINELYPDNVPSKADSPSTKHTDQIISGDANV